MWHFFQSESMNIKNILVTGQITYHEQFLLLPQCFQIMSAAEQNASSSGQYIQQYYTSNYQNDWYTFYSTEDINYYDFKIQLHTYLWLP